MDAKNNLYTDFLVDVNVLFPENENAALKHLNKVRLMKYVGRGRNPFELRAKFENVLCQIDGQGLKRPKLIEDWLAGKTSSKECTIIVERHLDNLLASKPKSTTLKLLNDVKKMVFDPEILCTILQPCAHVESSIRSLHAENKRVYIVGNMDRATFYRLKCLHPELFSLFSGHFVSGEEGYVKPNPRFFTNMILHLKVNCFKSYLIDSDDNLRAASTIGLSGSRSPPRV